jgi:DNA-binding CsgD family transcriptional regulator
MTDSNQSSDTTTLPGEAGAFIDSALSTMQRSIDLHQSAMKMLLAAQCAYGESVGLAGGPPRRAPAAAEVPVELGPAADHTTDPADPRIVRLPLLLAGADSNLLTRREREVLLLVVGGLSNRRIARQLGIAEKTVKNHLAAIFAKLRVSDRTQAALYAVRVGMESR